jgi:2-dehydropantoate 2-reductase
VEDLGARDAYDLIVVLVRNNQVEGMLPALAANTTTPNILFMVNNPSGFERWAQVVGRERLLVGFAGAGGTRQGSSVHYTIVPGLFQPTTFGEPDGRITPRLQRVAATFHSAGFPVAVSRNMDAWLKTRYHRSVRRRTPETPGHQGKENRR